ncbi:DUF6188 family protein, partial [Actinoplanes philippinensis]|uniref:DUF6188 family protein n=1 Tax=Actinoplanes philippinensis TaxID=35752 RepID=UPI0033C63862
MVAENGAGRRPRRGRSLDLLVGRRLEYVWLGHAVVLGFAGGCQVLIEAVAHLDGPGGVADVEPGDDPSDVAFSRKSPICSSSRSKSGGISSGVPVGCTASSA